MIMIETFTPEQIAVIARDRNRTPSANDLFVRYEDHASVIADLKAAGLQPFKLPLAAISDGILRDGKAVFTRGSLRAAGYKSGLLLGADETGIRWVKPFDDADGVRYSLVIDVVMSVNAQLQPERHLKAHAEFLHEKGAQIHSLVIEGQSLREVEDHFASLWNPGFHIHCDKVDPA